jgi:hypothetical protein
VPPQEMNPVYDYVRIFADRPNIKRVYVILYTYFFFFARLFQKNFKKFAAPILSHRFFGLTDNSNATS